VRVLIVDDNDAIRARAAAVLTEDCRVVGSVKDGSAALEAAQALQPEVMVLDISMPGMSGLEVAARLRYSGSSIAVVFLTVHDEPDFVEAAKAAGGVGYVVKPRLASDLPRAVRAAQAGRSAAQDGDEP
jgi:DNA-binding NarL/FixJ family response regulator